MQEKDMIFSYTLADWIIIPYVWLFDYQCTHYRS